MSRTDCLPRVAPFLYLAFCIPKIDEPGLFRRLKENGLIKVRRQEGREQPYVTDAREAYDLLVDDQTKKQVDKFFDRRRVGYFPIGTVGFYVDEQGRFDPLDS